MLSPRDLFLALLVVFVWGINFIFIKWGLEEIPPFLMTALRYITCAFPAVFFFKKPDVSWRLLITYGFIVGVLQFSFLFTAFRFGMPAGLASLVMQMQAFFTIAVAVLVLRERPGRFQLLGAAIALCGLAAIGVEQMAAAALLPLVLTLLASLSWAISNVVTKQAGKVDMVAFVVWGSLVPPLPMLTMSLVFEPGAIASLTEVSWRAWASAAFIGYASTLFGYGLWAGLLGRYPTSLVAPFTLLVPVVGFASAWLVLGETVSIFEIFGSALIFVGMVVNVFGPRLRAKYSLKKIV